MRIGIDAHILGKNKGGVETCLFSTLRALSRLDPVNEYVVYVARGQSSRLAGLRPNFRVSELAVSSPWLQRPFLIPVLYAADRLDVILLQRVLPFWGCRNSVLQIHDAIYASHSQLFPAGRRTLLNALMRWSGRRAPRVVTPSNASREAIAKHYKIDPGKIHVIPNGVDPDRFHPGDDSGRMPEIRRRFNLGKQYVFTLGAGERHKNTHTLVEAFALFHRHRPDYQLVIAGQWRGEGRGGYIAELKNRVKILGIEGAVVFAGYVPDEDRLALLSGAALLGFPSLAEGFGLPPLEAMACGVPVIASDLAVIREVCGEAAILVPPTDRDALAFEMERVTGDATLRQSLVEKGLQQARGFTWDRAAERLLEVFRTLG